VSTTGIPLINEDGTLKGYRGNDVDITERRLVRKSLEEVNRKPNILTSITRHDITNKLM